MRHNEFPKAISCNLSGRIHIYQNTSLRSILIQKTRKEEGTYERILSGHYMEDNNVRLQMDTHSCYLFYEENGILRKQENTKKFFQITYFQNNVIKRDALVIV